jgi:hypothetical protein
MATKAEVLAKAAEWDAAGKPENAAKLRAYAETLPDAAPDAAAVEAKAVEWEKAGKPENAARLREYAKTLPPAPAASAPAASAAAVPPGPVTPSRADPVVGSQEDRQRRIDELALFEMANPGLRGRFGPMQDLPRPGDVVLGEGAGRAAAAGQVTVQPWRQADVRAASDTFGETAGAMMEGPVAAMKAFGGGLTGGDSPARGYLEREGLPSAVAAPLGVIGDMGGAALSAVGAGLSGLIGLGTELVPGQTAAGERRLGDDLLGMSMMAVPELAGVSSVPARVAGAAPRVAAKVPDPAAVPVAAVDAATAERLGIPVMRTDIKPPETFIGKVAQKTGEMVPVAGTGGMRAEQNEARIRAAQYFARLYGAEDAAPAIDGVTAGLLEKRSADLGRYTKQKREVIEGLADKGAVPVPKAVAAIDAQIARLRGQKMASLEPVIAKLEDFKASITDQRLTDIEANRAVIGEAFSGFDMGAIRSVGEKALSAVYGPLRDDMAAFIKAMGGQTALNKWGSANAKLSEMAGELGNSALKRALSKGEATPETVRTLLFSAKPSDVKLLYQNLNDQGRASARTAIVQEALSKAGGIDDLSPDRFKVALGKLGSQIGVFFKGDDLEAATGLVRALQLTERAAVAGVTPPTGVQALPALMGIGLGGAFGMTGAVAAGTGIGFAARIYERAGVRRALQAVARAKEPQAERAAMQSLDKALIDSGAVSGNAAAQGAANANAQPDYEGLWGRYGQ